MLLKLHLLITKVFDLVVVEVDLLSESLSSLLKTVNFSLESCVVNTDLSGRAHVGLLATEALSAASNGRLVS